MGVRYLEAYGDPKLIINQVKGEYEVQHEDLAPYYHAVIKMANSFDSFYIGYVCRFQNTKADTLAALAVTLALLLIQFIISWWRLDVLSVLGICWKLMKFM